MKHVIFVCCLSLCLFGSISSVFAQDWIFLKTIETMEIYFKIDQCDGESVILMRVNNTGSYQGNISWNMILYGHTADNPNQVLKRVNHYQIPISANSENYGTCNTSEGSNFKVMSSEAYVNSNTPVIIHDALFKDLKFSL